MQVNDKIESHGCYIKDKETGKLVPYFPSFIPKGTHRVTHVNTQTMWGILVKTDKYQEWVNAGWFKPVVE